MGESATAGGIQNQGSVEPIALTEGTIVFEIEGEQSQHLQVGDAFYEPADVRVSKFDNIGDTPAKFVAFYLLGENKNETVQIL
jgi:quercetin dioxygenase-like cupin family protein